MITRGTTGQDVASPSAGMLDRWQGPCCRADGGRRPVSWRC